DTERFRQFTQKDDDPTSLLNNNIKTLFEDSKNQLWIGTAAGANLLDIHSFEITAAPVNDLLPNLVVNGIQEDDAGNLWIATNSGISKYNPREHSIQNFSKSDGLQGNEFNYTSSTKAQDGTMYFGGVKGLNKFHPSQVKMSDFNPHLAITDIKIFDHSVTSIVNEDGTALMEGSIQALSELTLQYNQNVVELVFASLDYTYPIANNYRYMLEGFDKEWMYTTTKKRAANYTNLNAGEYTFIVEGTNSDGIWSTKNRTLSIVVLPPWWETWWFRTIAAVIILGSLITFTRWRSRTIRRQKEELKMQVEDAVANAKEQNLVLQGEQQKLEEAIADTNLVVNEALESGNFSARINLENKSGAWLELGKSINSLFDSIVLPFQNINEIVGAMASSNLTIRYTDDAKGDILKMTSSLNYALDNLASLISTIRQTTQVIGSSSEEMITSSDEMSVGTAEIAASTSEMSNGAQEQVTKIDQASNKLEEIVASSSSAGEQAQSINQAAQRGVGLSAEGQGQMESMDQSMQKMESASAETGDSIKDLLEKSTEISGILNS
ncbi:MAG: triple tyrosine motif-containing protein, partial [Bacteroidota bacterium]